MNFVAIQLLNAALTGSFQASQPFLIEAERGALDIALVVTVGATVEYYMEYTDGDPKAAATTWYRELAETVAATGVITNAIAVRQIVANGGGNMAPGTYNVAINIDRKRAYARLQMRASAGTVTSAIVSIERALAVNS